MSDRQAATRMATSVLVGSGSVRVLLDNPQRLAAYVVTAGTSWIAFGGTAMVGTYGHVINPGIPLENFVWRGPVDAALAATAPVYVTELY